MTSNEETSTMIHSARRWRALAAVIAAGALIGSLAACSSAGTSTGTTAAISATGKDDGAKLTLWTRAPLEKQAKLLVAAYNSTHKNQVQLTVVPNDDYVAKVGAAAGSHGLPDLFAADIVYVPNWVKQGLFQDISKEVNGLSYKDSINKGHLAAGTYQGKEHVLPFVLDLSMLMWNKKIFKDAGLDPEKAPTTMAEYATDAKQIQSKLGSKGISGTATGLNCGGCLVFTWFPQIWAANQQVMNSAGSQSMLASDTAKSVYSTWADMWKAGAVLPSSKDESGATWTAGFTQGKVGLMLYPASLLSSTPFDAGVAGIPSTTGGASTFVGGDGIGIGKDSTKAAEAWNFLSWMMSEKAQVGVLAKDEDVVSRSDLADNQYSEKDPRLITINKVAGQGETPVALNFQQAFNAPGSPWVTLVRDAVLGNTDSKVASDNDAITQVLGQQ